MCVRTGIGLIVGILLGVWLGHLETPQCDGAVTFLMAERVAREGKTDREFYRQHPDHFAAGGTTIVVKKTP